MRRTGPFRRPAAALLAVATFGWTVVTPEPSGATQRPSKAPVLEVGDHGPWVRTLQNRLNQLDDVVCWWYGPCLNDYRVAVDGRFGPDTRHAVELFQANQRLGRDGVVGPKTWARLYAPQQPCEMARQALVAGGASAYETSLGVKISRRETGCRLLHVLRPSTGDNTYGAFGLNFHGRLMAARTKIFGHPSNNMTWAGSVRNFLKLARESGWCHWDAPNYCS